MRAYRSGWMTFLSLLLLLLLRTVHALDVNGLEVTKSDAGDIYLDSHQESSFFLSFFVCGDAEAFESVRYSIRLSQKDIRTVVITPILGAQLQRDDVAESRGMAVSLWSSPPAASSERGDRCMEVPMRIWTAHSGVLDSTIELRLGFVSSSSRFPDYHSGGNYTLHSAAAAATTAAATTAAATTAAAATEATAVFEGGMTAPTDAGLSSPVKPTDFLAMKTESLDSRTSTTTTTPTTDNNLGNMASANVHILISGSLGGLFIVAVVIIIIQAMVIAHNRRRRKAATVVYSFNDVESCRQSCRQSRDSSSLQSMTSAKVPDSMMTQE